MKNCVLVLLEMHQFLDDFHLDVDRGRDPRLCIHGVLGSHDERFDPQVLLEQPEGVRPDIHNCRAMRYYSADGRNRWSGKQVSPCSQC